MTPEMQMLGMVTNASGGDDVWQEADGTWWEVVVYRGEAVTYCCAREPRDVYGHLQDWPIVAGELAR